MANPFHSISKKMFFLLVAILFVAACKKKDKYHECTHCTCFDYNIAVAYNDTLIDSAAFFQAILGKWYVKEFDTFEMYSCADKCFCDTSFPLTIIDGQTLSIAFPGNAKDTFNYTFRINGGKVDPASGVFNVPISISQAGVIDLQYNNGYLLLTTLTATPGTLDFPPSYILTR